MPRDPKHHLKRIAAPKHWMLSKIGGIYAPRPAPGPHKLRECLPLLLLLRNRLKYAVNKREVNMILSQKLVRVDGKVRTDPRYPAGFMDVVTIERTNDIFRLLYDTKGRFTLHKITKEESSYKLLRIKKTGVARGKVPYVVTHDGRTIRYPHPDIKANDVVKYDLVNKKIVEHVKFSIGNLCMTTCGNNTGRVGIITDKTLHPGSEAVVKIQDVKSNIWSTLISNVFIFGKGNDSLVTLPRDKGVRLSVIEDRDRILQHREKENAK